ncbi:hypothetical protein KKB99_05235 [bacterium]|nr:hypothetical protein [bacterium]MBU1025400.1 hypothetical protein [bacterium]
MKKTEKFPQNDVESTMKEGLSILARIIVREATEKSESNIQPSNTIQVIKADVNRGGDAA